MQRYDAPVPGTSRCGRVTLKGAAFAVTAAMAASAFAPPASAATVGGVIAWGKPDYDLTIPPPDARAGVTAVSAGSTTALALKGGAVLAWGANNWGANEVPAAALSRGRQVATRWGHALGP